MPQSIVKHTEQEMAFRGIGNALQVLGAHLEARLELSGVSELAGYGQRRELGLRRGNRVNR